MTARTLIALPPGEPVSEVRTTLLTASLMELRKRKHDARYFELLGREHHETMRSIVPGGWAPIALAEAHYGACDGLGLSEDEQFAIGHGVGDRLHQNLLGTLLRLAKESGATPWTFLNNVPRLWERMMRGGGVALFELGPKDARLELHRCSLSRYTYCRNGWRGMIAGLADHVSRRAFVNLDRTRTTNEAFVALVSWA